MVHRPVLLRGSFLPSLSSPPTPHPAGHPQPGVHLRDRGPGRGGQLLAAGGQGGRAGRASLAVLPSDVQQRAAAVPSLCLPLIDPCSWLAHPSPAPGHPHERLPEAAVCGARHFCDVQHHQAEEGRAGPGVRTGARARLGARAHVRLPSPPPPSTSGTPQIAVYGFAFKKDTGDTRETPAIDVCRGLMADGANVS